MNDTFYKPSLNIESFIGENPSVDTEKFALFLKAYYEWLQSTTITLKSISGTFVAGEDIVGDSFGATATVKEVKSGSLVVFLKTRIPFSINEIVTGSTSAATGIITIVKDNVTRASGNVLNYKNLEFSVDKYVDYLREELYPSIPKSYFGDKRLLAQHFKDFYESRSNEQSYKFLFKLLYDQNIDFYYPGKDLLRVSDGKFEKSQIIRAVVTGRIFEFLNKTVVGDTSGSLGNIVDIKQYVVGGVEVAEMTLKLVSGSFDAGESIVDTLDETLTTTLYGMITGFTVNDAGSGYQVGDAITITGDGSDVEALVASIQQSPITALQYNTIGHGYQLGTTAIVSNSGTGGSGLIVRATELANTYTVTSGANTYTVGEISNVQIINRGSDYYKEPSITLEDTVIKSLGLLSENLITIASGGTNYGVGNTIVFTGGSGANATGVVASVVETTTYDLKFEDGTKMIAETGKDIIKNEDWLVKGAIARVELTNYGTGYTKISLPTITVTSTTGSSANLIATNIQGASANVSIDIANNVTGIGSIRAIEIKNFGVDYSSANADLTAIGDGNANVSVIISGLGIREGNWVGDDGKIDYKRIQDSYYYQDFSYVIRSGLVFTSYKETLKSIIHPVGLQAFGEILIQSTLDLTPIMLSTVQALNNEIQELVVFIKSLFDISASLSGSQYTRIINLPLANNANLTSDRQIVVHVESPSDVQIIKSKEDTIRFVKSEDISITNNQSYNLKLAPNRITLFSITYGEVEIATFSSDAISTLASYSFDTVYIESPRTYSKYLRNTLITGTVTFVGNNVIGTGTNFANNYTVGSSLILTNEKFIVKSVSNSTFLQVNITPSTPYVGVSAYIEQV
jgi:hypothetical protein